MLNFFFFCLNLFDSRIQTLLIFFGQVSQNWLQNKIVLHIILLKTHHCIYGRKISFLWLNLFFSICQQSKIIELFLTKEQKSFLKSIAPPSIHITSKPPARKRVILNTGFTAEVVDSSRFSRKKEKPQNTATSTPSSNVKNFRGILKTSNTFDEFDLSQFSEKPQPPQNENTKKCLSILQKIKKHPSSQPFLVPVNIQEEKDYLAVVKKPMDLGTVEKNIKNGFYANSAQLLSDLSLIWQNAQIYHVKESDIYKHASEISTLVESLFHDLGTLNFNEQDAVYKKKAKFIENKLILSETGKARSKFFNSNSEKAMSTNEKKTLVENVKKLSPEYLFGFWEIVSQCPLVTKENDQAVINFNELPPKILRNVDRYVKLKMALQANKKKTHSKGSLNSISQSETFQHIPPFESSLKTNHSQMIDESTFQKISPFDESECISATNNECILNSSNNAKRANAEDQSNDIIENNKILEKDNANNDLSPSKSINKNKYECCEESKHYQNALLEQENEPKEENELGQENIFPQINSFEQENVVESSNAIVVQNVYDTESKMETENVRSAENDLYTENDPSNENKNKIDDKKDLQCSNQNILVGEENINFINNKSSENQELTDFRSTDGNSAIIDNNNNDKEQ